MIVSLLLCLVEGAAASTYQGSWQNLSFRTAGAMTIRLDVTKTMVSGVFNFEGPVFGVDNPAPVSFQAPLKANGSGAFSVSGTSLGALSGNFSKDGKLVVTVTDIPSAVITAARIVGKFDLVQEKFSASYQVYSGFQVVALGLASARVIKAPEIQMPAKVTISKSWVNLIANVVVNSPITSVTAVATGGARVRVVGDDPYTLKVSNIQQPVTRITLTVTNRDGLTASKTVRIRKTPLSGVLSVSGFATAD